MLQKIFFCNIFYSGNVFSAEGNLLQRKGKMDFTVNDIIEKPNTFSETVRLFFAALFRNNSGKKAEAEALAEHFLNDYGTSLLRFAYTYVHNYEDAEEILQDAVYKVIKAAPVFENEAHEKAYLMKTVANLAKNRINYNRLRETDELNEELVGENREDLAFVWQAVKELPDIYREAVHLFYHEGYKTAQIAKITGRKESTVRSDLKRARDLLKEILKEGYDFD